MNSFPPTSPNSLSFLPIDPMENEILCDSKHAKNGNSDDLHFLSRKLCEGSYQLVFAGMQQTKNPDYILDTAHPVQKLQATSKEHKPIKDDESILEFSPFNHIDFDEQASSLGLLQIENMVDSFTDQLIFPNAVDAGVSMCLGPDFVPSNYHVICGRGKRAYNHVGNRRFKLTIAMKLRKYVDTNIFSNKMDIVDAVIDQIREATASTNGTGFVKVDSAGNWFDVGIEEAREKTSRAFRDFSTSGSMGTKCKSFNWLTSWDDERNKRVIDIQNSIFKSCRINFSGQCSKIHRVGPNCRKSVQSIRRKNKICRND